MYQVEGNITVESGAGCGKTFRIMEYLVSLLSEPDSPYSLENLAVITFTTKAAAELKQRTILRLSEEIERNPQVAGQIRLMGNARISTIHSFCARLLKENPVEAGIDPGFEILEDNGEFAHEVFIRWFKETLPQEADFFRKFLIDWNRPLEIQDYGYGSRQDKSLEAFLLKILEHRELQPFTPEAPDWQLMANLQQQLVEQAKRYAGRAEKETLVEFFTLLAKNLESLQFSEETAASSLAAFHEVKFSPGNTGGPSARELRQEWKAIYEPLTTELRRQLNYAACFTTIEQVYADSRRIIESFVRYYRRELKHAGYMDHTEILVATEELLRNARVVERIRKNIKVFIVDEFQDTDPLQAKILQHLVREGDTTRLRDKTLIIVGDPKQSIYGFRRADITMYRALTDELAAAGKRELLTVNRRSTKNILHWVNAHFSATFSQDAYAEFQPEYLAMQPYEEAPEGDPVQFVQAKGYDGFAANIEELRALEAKLTARAIEALLLGKHGFSLKAIEPRDILVLFRNRTNISALYQHLEALNIPVEAEGGMPLFERQEVQDAIVLLKALANPHDKVAIAAALRGPCFSISDSELFAHAQRGKSLRFDTRLAEEAAVPADDSVEAALQCLTRWFLATREHSADQVWELIGEEKKLLARYAVTYRGRQKVLNLLKFREILFGLRTLPFALAVDEVVERWESGALTSQFRDVTTEAGGAVRLMTVHAAKGLEARIVYIADCASQSLGPDAVQVSPADQRIYYCLHEGLETPSYYRVRQSAELKIAAEEERLRYVAATRARELLLINELPFLGKSQNGEIQEKHSSRFIHSLWQTREHASIWTVEPEDIPYMPYASLPKVSQTEQAAMAKEIAEMQKMHEQRKQTVASDSTLHSPSLAEAAEESKQLQILPRVELEELAVPELNELPRSDLGSLLHKMLELSDAEPLALARSLLRDYRSDISPESLANIYSELRRRLEEKHLGKADEIYRELPVLFTGSDGRKYSGSIDLLFRVGSEWYLADYKFSQLQSDELAKKYGAQLALYREALQQAGIDIRPENMVVLGFRV
jgi:ATP-dependent helicase/nuclease subunit A